MKSAFCCVIIVPSEGCMKIYQVINVTSDGQWNSPYVATIGMVDQVVERCKMGKCYIKEVELEENSEGVTRDYSARVLFAGQKGIDETLKIIVYPYDKEKVQEAKAMYERLAGNNKKNDNEPIKTVNTVVLRDRGSNCSEEVAMATDYMLAREIAVDFKNTMSTKNVAIVTNDLYVDPAALNEYLNRLIVGTVEESEAVWMLNSPAEKLYVKSQAENVKMKGEVTESHRRNAKLENQLKNEKEKNARLGREVKSLCDNLDEWKKYSDVLKEELKDQRKKIVDLGTELKKAQDHPIKNLFNKREK